MVTQTGPRNFPRWVSALSLPTTWERAELGRAPWSFERNAEEWDHLGITMGPSPIDQMPSWRFRIQLGFPFAKSPQNRISWGNPKQNAKISHANDARAFPKHPTWSHSLQSQEAFFGLQRIIPPSLPAAQAFVPPKRLILLGLPWKPGLNIFSLPAIRLNKLKTTKKTKKNVQSKNIQKPSKQTSSTKKSTPKFQPSGPLRSSRELHVSSPERTVALA